MIENIELRYSKLLILIEIKFRDSQISVLKISRAILK